MSDTVQFRPLRFDGDQVAIDELSHEKVTYESMCAECYLRESGGRLS